MRRSNSVLAEKVASDDSVIAVCLPQSMYLPSSMAEIAINYYNSFLGANMLSC